MPEFVYKNAQNRNISYILFKLNNRYYLCIFFEQKIDPYSKSQLTNKLAKKLDS